MDHPDVADAAVIGVNDELKGEVPVGFVVAVAGSTTDESELGRQLIERGQGAPMPKERRGLAKFYVEQ